MIQSIENPLGREDPSLIPAVWDNLAKTEPDRVIAAIPLGTEINDGFRDITAHMMASAISRAAWFLERKLGRSQSFETLCYIGPSDLRYPILLSAAAKTGYKTFWTSPRNSFEGHVRLMKATECKTLLTPADLPHGMKEVIEELHMQHVTIPDQTDWLDATDHVVEYPFKKTYAESCLEPFSVIHTSGSTSFPKPVVIPHGYVCLGEVVAQAPDVDELQCLWKFMHENPGRIFHPFPMFHGAGLFLFHHFGQFYGHVPVLPPNKPLTAELANEMICSGSVDSAFLPPAVFEDIFKVQEFTENLSRLRFTMFAGAAPPDGIGEVLRRKTKFISAYSQTELGILPLHCLDHDDYTYLRFGSLSGIELRHYADNLYELVMVRKKGLEKYQGAFMVDASLQEVHSRDLFSRHPDPAKPDLWMHRGRTDDVIVFATGEKLNPVTLERLVESDPQISSALVFGQGHVQSALILQPTTPTSDTTQMLNLLEIVWPTVEAANKMLPAHGRIVKEFIIFSTPERPFVRTAKGSIVRQKTFELYEPEIDALYAAVDELPSMNGPLLDTSTREDVFHSQLRDLVRHATSIDEFGDDDDFYSRGMDSLQTLQLSRRLKSALASSQTTPVSISPSLIYANPTLRHLANSIRGSEHCSKAKGTNDPKRESIEDIIDRYSVGLPHQNPSQISIAGTRTNRTVILTGSTGSLGSYLLAALYHHPSITHIYCLNRSADAQSRQKIGNAARGLASEFDPSRVTFMHCKLTQPLLGLEQNDYDRLKKTTTHILHNAWTVNFNLALSTLVETNIAGVRSLIDLAATSECAAQLFFVSSVGTVMNWSSAGHKGPVPEDIIHDIAVPEAIGYSISKFIAENLLSAAQKRSGIHACCLRVGQIAGPIKTVLGEWNRTEWFPSFLRSSKTLGLLPKTLGTLEDVDWIPVNVLADVIVELLDHGVQHESTAVYNLVNPSQTTWNQLYLSLKKSLETDGQLVQVVNYDDWLKELHKSASNISMGEVVEKNPAIKILDFFDGLNKPADSHSKPLICTEKAEINSPTLRGCGPVRAEWIDLWVRQLRLST